MNDVLYQGSSNSGRSFFQPDSVGLLMGQKGQVMGCPIGLSLNMFELASSKDTSITNDTPNYLPHIRPRTTPFLVDELNDFGAITLKRDITKAAILRKENCVVQRYSFGKSWIVGTAHLPSCCSEELTIRVTTNSSQTPSANPGKIRIAVNFYSSFLWLTPS
jgi:hypothetical protein